MKAVVTGVAGFIGSQLAEALVGRGFDVLGVDCFTDYYPRQLKEANLAVLRTRPAFRFFDTSIQEAAWPTLLDGEPIVFHLAAQAGVRKSWGAEFHAYTVNNIEATQRLLEACTAHPVAKLVYASSSSVYGDDVPIPMHETALPRPVSPYGVTKLAAEQLCHLYFANYGVPSVSLRYFTVYGPRQRPDMGFHRFLKAGLCGHPITVFGDGGQTRDFTFVADAVRATIEAALRGIPGRVYNIGGGSRVSIADVLPLVERAVGRPLTIVQEAPQKGDMRDTFADTSAARTDLGFAPTVSLDAGLRAECDWLRDSAALSL
jgi:UDP-glucose 4-epimerase